MKGEKFVMERVGIAISLICNLKCKLCMVYSPYCTDTTFPDISEVKSWIKKYFDIVDYVKIFTFSGGEPLLYKQLPDVLESFSEYSEKIGKLEIITNGTTVPSDELISAAKKLGEKFSRFLIDDYGENLSCKIKEIERVLNASGLKYDIRNYNSGDLHCDGWVDLGSMEKIFSYKEASEVYAKCAQPQKLHFCFSISDGIMVPCGAVSRRIFLGHNVDKNDYIDLMDKSLSIEEQRQKISNIYNSKCLETCMYCTGFCDDSVRYKPAEQFTPEEIRKIRQKQK